METIPHGMENHALYFPKANLNSWYLNHHARRFSSLEEDIDSWKLWAPLMPEDMARSEVDALRDRVFRLMMEMGPAAEAYHWSISPALNRPKTVTPWHQISLKKLRKVKNTSKQALKQALEAKAEISAAKAEMEALKMENLCLKLKNLKI